MGTTLGKQPNQEAFGELYFHLTLLVGDDPSKSSWYEGITLDFKNADKEGTGMLSEAVFRDILEEYFDLRQIEPSEENYTAHFKKIDRDADGKVSLEDYLAFACEVVKEEILPELQEFASERGLKIVTTDSSS